MEPLTKLTPLRYIACLLLAAGLCSSRVATAEPSAADRATARTLAQAGHEALVRQDYAVAADRLSRAEALVHAPTLLRDLARAQAGLGRLVEAQENYNRIIREGVAPNAPASWFKALEEASREVRELSPRLPWVTISVSGTNNPLVKIDGVPIPPASLDVRRPLDPGSHTIEASAPGFLARQATIKLEEGQTLGVVLELEPAKEPPAPPRKIAPLPAKGRLSTTEQRWRTPATVIAFAFGGVGVAVGATFGALALDQRSELSRACTKGLCDEAQRSQVDRYYTVGTLSTIGFVAGATGFALGTVLVLTKPKREGNAALGPSVVPVLQIGAAGIKGRF